MPTSFVRADDNILVGQMPTSCSGRKIPHARAAVPVCSRSEARVSPSLPEIIFFRFRGTDYTQNGVFSLVRGAAPPDFFYLCKGQIAGT